MTRFLLFSALVLLSCNAFAQKKTSVTFDVCDLQQVPHKFYTLQYKNSIDRLCGKGVEAWSKGSDSVLYTDVHPFVATVRDAYLNHRPLTLSPDMIWLLIAQGFALHVDENSESLRHYFVDFDGKKVLKVERDGFVKGSPDNDWQNVFPDFTKQIGDYTGKKLLNTTLCHFSTTGPAEKAAFEVTLMDAMSSYFIYAVYSITCGIPKITLEGTAQDWDSLRIKASALGKYDLKWWTDSLKPVLDQFVNAANGKVDKNFWGNIYDITSVSKSVGCGSETVNYVTGWLTKFFPYRKLGNGKYEKRTNLSARMEYKDFTSGLSKADFYWYYDPCGGGCPVIYQMEFIAGFFGGTLDRSTGGLRPSIGWAIRDTGKQGIKDEDQKYKDDIMTPPNSKGK